MSLNIIPGLNGRLEYSSDGVTFAHVLGAESISVSGGEAPENDVVAFEGIAKVSGHLRVPSVSISVSGYNPQHASWAAIAVAAKAGTTLNWRFITQEEAFYTASGSGNTAAITAAGVVTLAGTTPDFTGGQFAPGMVLQIGTDKYVIDTISPDTGAVKVKPAPASAVAAATAYKIINPSLRLGPFLAKVRSIGNAEMSSEGALTTTLDLTPRAQLPDWALV